MNLPFNRLSNSQAERLALLSEELAESIQIVGKILRHGYESYHPDNPTVSNRFLLEKELGDVMAAIQLLTEASDLSPFNVDEYALQKLSRIGTYLHHQGE